MKIEELVTRLDNTWSAETSSNPEQWSETNRALGQCAVTALVVQDHFGGEILNTTATLPDGNHESHYLNAINDEEIDLTRQQFPNGTTFSEAAPKPNGHASTREYILSYEPTATRYKLLKKLLEATNISS